MEYAILIKIILNTEAPIISADTDYSNNQPDYECSQLVGTALPYP